MELTNKKIFKFKLELRLIIFLNQKRKTKNKE